MRRILLAVVMLAACDSHRAPTCDESGGYVPPPVGMPTVTGEQVGVLRVRWEVWRGGAPLAAGETDVAIKVDDLALPVALEAGDELRAEWPPSVFR